jgi:hypothetical protein
MNLPLTSTSSTNHLSETLRGRQGKAWENGGDFEMVGISQTRQSPTRTDGELSRRDLDKIRMTASPFSGDGEDFDGSSVIQNMDSMKIL